MPKRKKVKSYKIIEKKTKYLFGAFPRTKEGRKLAKEYIVKLSKKDKSSAFKVI